MTSAKAQELILLAKISFYLIIALVVLAYVTISLRLWVRYRITKSPGWDDAATVATLILFTCYCAFVQIILFRSRQSQLFNDKDIRVTLIYVQLSEVFYVLTTTLLKVSLGLFFLRVLTKRWQIRIFHVILGVSISYGLFYVFLITFRCGDPAKFADKLLGSSKCLPRNMLLITGYLYGVINIIADWTFVLIPISVLIDSDLDRRSKISVSLVMALGAVGSVSSILRMVYLHGLAISTGLSAASVKATIWATAEPGTGIIAASVATLRPLLRKIASDVRSKASSYGSQKDSHPPESDTIALTSQSKKKSSVYSIQSENPWSPTVGVGHTNPPRMMNSKGTSIQTKSRLGV